MQAAPVEETGQRIGDGLVGVVAQRPDRGLDAQRCPDHQCHRDNRPHGEYGDVELRFVGEVHGEGGHRREDPHHMARKRFRAVEEDRYTDSMVKKLKPNDASTQLASSRTIEVMAMSADMTNARDIRREGHSRHTQTHAQKACSATNTATATCDATVLADGNRITAEMIASSPVPSPIRTWTAPDIARLKYCTCAAWSIGSLHQSRTRRPKTTPLSYASNPNPQERHSTTDLCSAAGRRDRARGRAIDLRGC